AFALPQLKPVDQALQQRRAIAQRYRRLLAGVPGIQCLRPGTPTFANNAYFPILVEHDFPLSRDAPYHRLRHRPVLVRRYSSPL
ncbi:DegT/DnrJ/EryC1/StrS family aminotransferase, partial [Pseudomonas aeruginosa]